MAFDDISGFESSFDFRLMMIYICRHEAQVLSAMVHIFFGMVLYFVVRTTKRAIAFGNKFESLDFFAGGLLELLELGIDCEITLPKGQMLCEITLPKGQMLVYRYLLLIGR